LILPNLEESDDFTLVLLSLNMLDLLLDIGLLARAFLEAPVIFIETQV